jgi:hypothetical protein
MDQQVADVSVLAGNSRVYLDENSNIVIEAQLKAFEAALRFARQRREDHGRLPRLSVAFDHRGIFRLQFLAKDLTHGQKRHPRLSHLAPSIQQVFLPIAEKHGIPLTEIRAIHEDSARQHLVHTLATGDIPEMLKRRMVTDTPADEKSRPDDAHQDAPTQKLTCAAITKEYFESAAGEQREQGATLEVFFEDSAWSGSLAYVRGLQLSHLLGVRADIRLNLVDEVGAVSKGELIPSRPTLSPIKEDRHVQPGPSDIPG